MNIAIIPARGGSKRIPRKNIREFAGKPMIAYAIDAARQSGLFEHVIVSTDDQEIADMAKAWAAEIPFMSPKNWRMIIRQRYLSLLKPLQNAKRMAGSQNMYAVFILPSRSFKLKILSFLCSI